MKFKDPVSKLQLLETYHTIRSWKKDLQAIRQELKGCVDSLDLEKKEKIFNSYMVGIEQELSCGKDKAELDIVMLLSLDYLLERFSCFKDKIESEANKR